MKSRRTCSLVFVIVAVCCGCDSSGNPTGISNGPKPNVIEERSGMLVIEDSSTDKVAGTFTSEPDVVRFVVRSDNSQLLDIQIELNGMVLTAMLSLLDGTSELDCFTSGTGAETQMHAEDRSLLLGLERELERQTPSEEDPRIATLIRFVSIWAQASDTFPLQRTIVPEPQKSYDSLCGVCGQWAWAWHDCDRCGIWDGPCNSQVIVGDRTPSTEYFVNGAWTAQPQDHLPNAFERGDCYGHCGEGCPAGGTYQQILTQDCLNHDQCVRNGHNIASLYCDDEFAGTLDDAHDAPRCGWSSVQTAPGRCNGPPTCVNIPKFGVSCICANGAICPTGYTYSSGAVVSTTGSTTCSRTVSFCP